MKHAFLIHDDADDVHDVLHAIYRPLQSQPAAAAQVTFSLDLLLFASSAPLP